ncbi:MAG: hypothetical protein Q9203_005550 [Teloschistes exilis]
MRLTSLLPLLPVLASSITAYPNPGPCTGACNVHDPALILRPSDNTYFRFSTGSSIQIATTYSLAGPWTIAGSALPQNGSSIDLPGNTDAWAPDVSLVDGMYYLYYSVSTFGSQRSAIGVATSKTLDVGGWMDHGSVGVRSDGSVTWNAIDANLVRLHDGSGGYQLVFGSFYGGIHVVNMSDPLVAGSDGVEMTQVVYDPEGSHAVEGGFMYSRVRSNAQNPAKSISYHGTKKFTDPSGWSRALNERTFTRSAVSGPLATVQKRPYIALGSKKEDTVENTIDAHLLEKRPYVAHRKKEDDTEKSIPNSKTLVKRPHVAYTVKEKDDHKNTIEGRLSAGGTNWANTPREDKRSGAEVEQGGKPQPFYGNGWE